MTIVCVVLSRIMGGRSYPGIMYNKLRKLKTA